MFNNCLVIKKGIVVPTEDWTSIGNFNMVDYDTISIECPITNSKISNSDKIEILEMVKNPRKILFDTISNINKSEGTDLINIWNIVSKISLTDSSRSLVNISWLGKPAVVIKEANSLTKRLKLGNCVGVWIMSISSEEQITSLLGIQNYQKMITNPVPLRSWHEILNMC